MVKLYVFNGWGAYIPKKIYRTGGSKTYIPKSFYTKTTYIILLSEKFGGSDAPSPFKVVPLVGWCMKYEPISGFLDQVVPLQFIY
ncbi:hypothetical protein Hanom_Chr01g00080331 [Helianthus anomalus]